MASGNIVERVRGNGVVNMFFKNLRESKKRDNVE